MNIPKDILDKETYLKDWSILVGWRGSIAHGMYVPKEDPNSIDDKDVMAIVVPPIDHYYGLENFGSRGTKDVFIREYDIVTYEVKKFVSLLTKGNPNVLSMLWLDPNYYIQKTEAGQLLLDNRDLFVTKEAYHSFVGYSHSQLHKMTHQAFEGYMGNKRKELVQKFGYDCYIERTEFLTETGWKNYEDIGDDVRLGTINPKTHQLEYQNFTDRIKKKYNGEVFSVENRYTKCVVTPNHRMYVSPAKRSKATNFSSKFIKEHSNWQYHKCEDLIKNHRSLYHVINTNNNLNLDYDVDDEYLMFLGLYVSEGSVSYSKNKKGLKIKCLNISQTENGKYEVFDSMTKIFKKYPHKQYTYLRKHTNVNETTFKFYDKTLISRVVDDCDVGNMKRLPNWINKLSKRQCNILLNNLIYGDGTFKKTYASVYYTNSKIIADGVQLLSFLSGRKSQLYDYKDKYKIYQIYIRNNDNEIGCIHFSKKIKKSKKSKLKGTQSYHYDGNVVCFTVPNENLITRIDGKIAIQGNTKNASHLIRLLRMGIEFLNEGRLHVMRQDNQQLLEIKRGEWTLEQVKTEATHLFKRAEEAYDKSTLPTTFDKDKVNTLLIEVTKATHEIYEYL